MHDARAHSVIPCGRWLWRACADTADPYRARRRGAGCDRSIFRQGHPSIIYFGKLPRRMGKGDSSIFKFQRRISSTHGPVALTTASSDFKSVTSAPFTVQAPVTVFLGPCLIGGTFISVQAMAPSVV